jgi:DNA-binding transcriptional regulator GbsR (MarR family)
MLKITSHLLIHGSLTQKEIKELTGLSIGTISTYLSVLLSTGRLVKNRIPGTHTYTYSFSGSLEDLGAKGLQGALKSIENSVGFLKNKKGDLKKLAAQSKKGATHIANRIDEILGAFEAYKQIFADFKLEE